MKYLSRSRPSRRAPLHGLARKAKKTNRLFSLSNRRTLVEALEDRRLLSVNVMTDKADYLGGSTAYFTGSGFDPGASVQFQVTKTSITPNEVKGAWSVTDGNTTGAHPDLDGVVNGSVKTDWYVDPSFSVGASFDLTATGLSGGLMTTAETTFTDSEGANLNQGQNGKPSAPQATTSWVNGNLNENNSHYGEGDSVPFQLDLTGLTGSTHTVTIQFDYTVSSGNHAYDYLTSFDRLTFNNQTVPNPLDGTGVSGTGTMATATSTFALPIDTNINNVVITPAPNNNPPANSPFVQIPGLMAMFDNAAGSATNKITNVFYSDEMGNPTAPPAQQGSALAGTITIQFISTGQSEVVLSWGGHIGSARDWGQGNSATAISGSPYHMRLIALDGGGGNQDRSLKASAVAGDFITVAKITDPASDTTTQFPFTLSGANIPVPIQFNLTGGSSQTFGPFFDGTYSVVENVPADWNLTNINVVDPTGNSSFNLATATTTVVLSNGETVSTTYTDTQIVNTTVSTVIFNAATNTALVGNPPHAALGTSVYDTATIGGLKPGVTPTGTITYEFFTTIDGTGSHTDQVVNLNPDGSIPHSTATAALAAGSYSYIAIYSGDTHYHGATGTVEPLIVDKANITVLTDIHNANGGAILSGNPPHAALGTSVFDTASFSGQVGSFVPTIGNVSYTFNGAASGSGAQSTTQGPLAAGNYQFQASFSGDANYNAAISAVEPLVIDKANITVNTDIHNAAGGAVLVGNPPHAALGTSVFDTASFSGQVGSFVPTIGNVSYTFNGAASGSGAQSTTQGPLAAGNYQFQASFSGDANYNAAISAVEPLVIDKANITVNTDIHNAAGGAVLVGNPPHAALGTSVFDTASFSGQVGSFVPTIGNVSYTFNGAASGSGAQSTTQGPLAAGNYQFQASFSGDANYNAAISAVEPLVIDKANITVNTDIHNAAGGAVLVGNPPHAPLGTSVFDTASFSGQVGSFVPTIGNVSYTFNGAASGSGAQSTTQGPLAAGNYQFQASFSGDANYNAAISAVEPLVIDKANITVNTDIHNAAGGAVLVGNPPHAPLGTSVFDTASFSGQVGSFVPTIGNVSYTFNGAASGSGAQSTTQGPLAAGNYQFQASFSGDANYNAAISAVEPLVIDASTLMVNTVIHNAAGGAVIPGSPPHAALGTSVFDTASFSGTTPGLTPTGTVTYQFYTTINGTGPHVDQVVVIVGGSVPDSAVHGPLAAGSYSFVAVYSGDANYGMTSGAVEPLVIDKANITVNTDIHNAAGGAVLVGNPPHAALGTSVFDTASFSGQVGSFVPTIGNVSYTFNGAASGSGAQSTTQGPLAAGNYQFQASFSGDANYNAAISAVEPLVIDKANITVNTDIHNAAGGAVIPGTPPHAPVGTSVFDTATFSGATPGFTPTIANVSYTFTNGGTHAAGSGAQSTVQGPLNAGNYSFQASFSGDSNYNAAISDVEPLVIDQVSPTIVTTPNPTNVTLGTTTVTLKDTATLSGGFNPTGTITFQLFSPGNVVVDTETVTVSGNGTYSTPTGFTLPTIGTVTGTYQWVASYSGDGNNNGALSELGEEPVIVNPAIPTITTQPGGSVVIGTNVPLTDTADLEGGYFPTGTITFQLYDPSNVVVDTETVTVNGNGHYSTPSGFIPMVTGTYEWVATYSGDGNNISVASPFGDEPEAAINPNFIVISSDAGSQRGDPLLDAQVQLLDRSTGRFFRVFNEDTGEFGFGFDAYDKAYQAGVRVALADMDGDGQPEIITTPGRLDTFNGPAFENEVRIFKLDFSVSPQNPLIIGVHKIGEFSAYPGTTVSTGTTLPAGTDDGGVQLAVGDVNGDGRNDIVTVPTRGPIEVKVFTNTTPPGSSNVTFTQYADFKPADYKPTTFRGGGVVAVADVGKYQGAIKTSKIPDGKAEIIVGNGSGMRSLVEVFNVNVANHNKPALVKKILPFSNTFRGGMFFDTGDITGDRVPDLVIGSGNGGNSLVQVYNGCSWAKIRSFQAFNQLTDAALSGGEFADQQGSQQAPVRVAIVEVPNKEGEGTHPDIVTLQGTDGKSHLIKFWNAQGQLDYVLNADPNNDFFGPNFEEFIAVSGMTSVRVNPL